MYRLKKRKSHAGLAAAIGWRARAGAVWLTGMGVAAARLCGGSGIKRPSRAESWTPARRLGPAPCSFVDCEGAQ